MKQQTSLFSYFIAVGSLLASALGFAQDPEKTWEAVSKQSTVIMQEGDWVFTSTTGSLPGAGTGQPNNEHNQTEIPLSKVYYVDAEAHQDNVEGLSWAMKFKATGEGDEKTSRAFVGTGRLKDFGALAYNLKLKTFVGFVIRGRLNSETPNNEENSVEVKAKPAARMEVETKVNDKWKMALGAMLMIGGNLPEEEDTNTGSIDLRFERTLSEDSALTVEINSGVNYSGDQSEQENIVRIHWSRKF